QELINISMANQIAAKILRSNVAGVPTIERGEIGINQLPEIPSQPGIAVRGSFDQLNLDQWLEALATIKSANTGITANALPIQRVDMSVNVLDVFERRINALNFGATQAADGWQMQIQSREMNGDVRWIDNENGKILARLKNLTAPAK